MYTECIAGVVSGFVMGSVPKLRFVDPSGSPYSSRYHIAIHRLGDALWQRYPYVRDETDRDNTIEEALGQAAAHEQKHGEAQNLLALIRHIFPRVAFRRFVRKPHYTLYEESKTASDLEALGMALRDRSLSLEEHIYVNELIGSLNERERQVLSLWILGYETKDMADTVGISSANVRQTISRIKKALRQAL